jgi:hypothetical protein
MGVLPSSLKHEAFVYLFGSFCFPYSLINYQQLNLLIDLVYHTNLSLELQCSRFTFNKTHGAAVGKLSF